jgi:hypothetical protein
VFLGRSAAIAWPAVFRLAAQSPWSGVAISLAWRVRPELEVQVNDQIIQHKLVAARERQVPAMAPRGPVSRQVRTRAKAPSPFSLFDGDLEARIPPGGGRRGVDFLGFHHRWVRGRTAHSRHLCFLARRPSTGPSPPQDQDLCARASRPVRGQAPQAGSGLRVVGRGPSLTRSAGLGQPQRNHRRATTQPVVARITPNAVGEGCR